MSEISTRSQVSSVDSYDYGSAGQGAPVALLPPRSIRNEIETRYRAALEALGGTREPVRAAALTSVQGLSASLVAAPAVQAAIRAVAAAPGHAGIAKARTQLASAVVAQQERAFTAAIAQACVRAAAGLSFTSVEVSTGADGARRVLAKDAAGRALVSEIKTDARGEVSLETEVSGARDPECGKLMSAWDEAIALEGVRSSPTRRRKTGGVAQLQATIAHVFAKAPQRSPAPPVVVATPADAPPRRRRAAGRARLKAGS